MKLVVQRVNSACVKINNEKCADIDKGLLVLFGAEKGDDRNFCQYLANKTVNLRIFEDENGKMGKSVKDIEGEIIIVSQFTLAGNCKKGLRPDFTGAMAPEDAKIIYEDFVEHCRSELGNKKVQTGQFAADMKVGLENDGPVTIILEKRS
ncbi:MAG: D-tyrosyl-tRNA(Tyr) deacylase [Denitrovibrio sp.]|nr:MAG: D-tyrosyl-tRNA(Tyr) deacylase [Denitrovibrio sp.]